MVTGVLFLALLLLVLLLAAFVYEIVTTPLAAVDAPTLVRTAAAGPAHAPAPPGPAPPVRQQRAATLPTATGPSIGASPRGAAGRLQSSGVAALTIAGLAAILIGGWLFLRIAHGAAVCAHQAFQVCSQGYVLLTGTQLAGGAIAVAGMVSVIIAIVLALR
jgi:hypothetical protein